MCEIQNVCVDFSARAPTHVERNLLDDLRPYVIHHALITPSPSTQCRHVRVLARDVQEIRSGAKKQDSLICDPVQELVQTD